VRVVVQTEAGRDVAYPVNVIAFNPAMGTFVTGGCDGLVNVWDGANKKRLHQYPAYPTSIAALAFNSVGSLLAVASSYTFEQGDVVSPRTRCSTSPRPPRNIRMWAFLS
jgi:cell cycle arrest protein BUB3